MAEIRQRLPEKAGRRTSSKYSKNKINIADKRSYTFYTVFLLSLLSGICFYFNWIGNFTATYDNSLALSELPKALVDDIYNKTGWGTMRPQLYFGLKTKHPNSPLFGLLWYKQPQEQLISSLPIRHWCEHGDDVKFSYEAHDGKTFGRQQIVDRELQLQTSWIAVGQRSWSARLTGKVEENEDSGKSSYALVFYLATRGHTSGLIPHNQMIDDSVYAFLAGASQQLGQFTLEFRIKPSAAAISHVAYTIPPQMDMRHVNELVLASLARGQSEEQLKLHQNPQIPGPQAGEGGANFAAVQFMVSGNFDLKLHFLAAEDEPLDNFEAAFAHKMTDFDQKFVDAFPIDSTFGQQRELAKRAVASLLGGIGVWHGHALVRTGEHEEPQPYGPLSLLSAVPSRPFFPRGFLWDEGFHNLLIRRFDPELSLQIFASWMDTMNVDGWIPREMILGEEAQAKVPAEFLVQRPSIANPPMFFYVLDKFVRNTELLKRHHHQIARIYPRLKQLYIWLRQTQRGPRPGTMQWQGRNRTTDRELNPKILPSGLDDFPRATHPSPEEYHLDLRCWMALSSRVLRHLAETFGDSDWVPVVEEDMRAFNDVAQLDDLHWSEEQQRYADFGLHSSRVKLVQVTLKKEAKRAAHGEGQQQERQFVRKVLEEPRLRLVDDVFGYVNLFPILLRLLPNDCPKLGILLRSLNRTEDLWTSYGLRSLSTKSPYYLVKNTEHDPPYWRGPVWINMNYLALDALRHYASSGGGPNVRLATQLYEQLRDNVVRNIAEQYAKTGFFWEHYNDRTGEGMGTRPFTGWTALVANILAEAYD